MVTIPYLNIDTAEFASDPQLHALITGIAIIATAFTFFAPTYYRRKSALARGLSETIRILETNESHNARHVLYLKYQKNKDVQEDVLKKSAEKVRNDLLMIQTMFIEKALASKVFESLYSIKMVRTIENYFEFMNEFHPELEVELPIKKLFKKSYRWYKRESKVQVSKEFEGKVEDMWDRLGL